MIQGKNYAANKGKTAGGAQNDSQKRRIGLKIKTCFYWKNLRTQWCMAGGLAVLYIKGFSLADLLLQDQTFFMGKLQCDNSWKLLILCVVCLTLTLWWLKLINIMIKIDYIFSQKVDMELMLLTITISDHGANVNCLPIIFSKLSKLCKKHFIWK